jgi:hypothetical protein
MIPRRRSLPLKPVPTHHTVRFVAMIPLIRKHSRFAFRDLPAAIRQERTDDALAHAFVLFAHLVHRRRVRLAHPTALARYAVYRVQSGRPLGSRMNSGDVMSPAAQRRHRFRVNSADTGCFASDLRWTELLSELRHATPADLAAMRIDFAAWLRQLSARHRDVALCMAFGETTGALARRYQVSCGRISQIRHELATLWRTFQGERDPQENTAAQCAEPPRLPVPGFG